MTIMPRLFLNEKVWADAAYSRTGKSDNSVLKSPFILFLAPTHGKNISKEQKQTKEFIEFIKLLSVQFYN
jgi:hypothetical protein